MTTEQLHKLFLEFPEVCTDTRRITKDCLFFALKGPNFNGNAFAQQALEKGAAYAVIDESEYNRSDQCILVDDVLKTLQELGTYHRFQNKATIISLTGSNGKTTTKELIYHVLSQKFNTIATKGNLNNHIGVPLTLLSIKEDTEMAIVEMGANHQKEIAFLSSLAQPDHGYITNFGKAHLEGFGGVEGVIKGKSELYDYLISHSKHVFFNADDPIQVEKLAHYSNKTGFSSEEGPYLQIRLMESTPFLQISVGNTLIKTQLTGKYNFPNCAVAILMGQHFNLPMSLISKGIAAYLPDNNRSQLLELNGVKIVLDAYNANPTSMKAALESYAELQASKKVVVLGDMFELGESAAEEHQRIAELAEQLAFNACYLVGSHFNKTHTNCMKFETFEDLAAILKTADLQNATVLIKGSRGMALERVLTLL